MKLIQFTILILAWLLLATVAQATPLEMADAPQEILGAAGSYLPLVAHSKQATWQLIKVVTDQFSGTEYENGYVTVSGSYVVIYQLGAGVAFPEGRYSWSQPAGISTLSYTEGQTDPELSRWLEAELFSCRLEGKIPQSATRILLCTLHEKAAGQDKFTNVHLVPMDWQRYVLPAVTYLRSHPNLDVPSDAASGWTQAKSLLHDSNPYLVLSALQLLAASKNLTPADMDTAFSSTDSKVIACSIVIEQLYLWSDIASNAQWLRTKIATIKSLNQLEGVAFGILSTSPLTMRMSPGLGNDLPPAMKALAQPENNFNVTLLPLVRQKLTELDPNGGPADERWRNIDAICRQGEMMQKYLSKPQTTPDAGKQP
jgi:hypothetical protein